MTTRWKAPHSRWAILLGAAVCVGAGAILLLPRSQSSTAKPVASEEAIGDEGTTLFYAPDPSGLRSLTVDQLYDGAYPFVALGVMNTLDFVEVARSAGQQWSVGEPIRHDDALGFSIFKVDPKSLATVLQREAQLDQYQVKDIRRLRSFTEKFGVQDIYEFATF